MLFRSSLQTRAGCGRLWAAVFVSLAAGCEIRDKQVQQTAGGANQFLRADAPALATMLDGRMGEADAARRTLEYVEDFAAGQKRAAAESKPMLVVCRAAWCQWSAEMTQGPLADPRIIRLADRFVCVMIDADRHADTCRTLGVAAFPTVILIDPAGEERMRSVGRPSTRQLAAALEECLHPSVAAGEPPAVR